MTALKKAWMARKSPLVVNRSIDWAFLALWTCYAFWGASAAFINTTYLRVPLTFYPTIWGCGISLFSIIAILAILRSLACDQDQLRERIFAKRVEALSVTAMAGFITVYPILQVFRLFTDEPPRPDLVALGMSYLIMIVFRVRLQLTRIQELREVDRRYQEEVPE